MAMLPYVKSHFGGNFRLFLAVIISFKPFFAETISSVENWVWNPEKLKLKQTCIRLQLLAEYGRIFNSSQRWWPKLRLELWNYLRKVRISQEHKSNHPRLDPRQAKPSQALSDIFQNFTPPDFRAKNFTPSISPNFNSFSKKKHNKWVKMEKFTPLAKILHCRRHWRHGQIPPLDSYTQY